MQHKKELGNMYVIGVRILRNDGSPGDTHTEVDLVFHIEDIPPEKRITDEPIDVNIPLGRAGIQASAVVGLVAGDAVAAEEEALGPNDILRPHKVGEC